MTGPVMQQWVIYDHPRDFPNNIVVRHWLIWRGGEISATDEVWLRDDVEGARDVIRANFPDGYRLARQPDDDPTIVEVWT